MSRLTGVRVLLIEDDDDTRDLCGMLLQEAGADVRAASGAEEAMHALRDWLPSIVVSDITMPVKNGLTLLQELRSTHELQYVPAVAVTAWVLPKDRDAVLAAGFQEHVAKPVEPKTLIDAISRSVGAASSTAKLP